MNVLLANPRGFCAGVDRAIEVVERVLKVFPPPVYVRHEVVHNKFVVDSLKAKGAIFVEEIEEVPSGAIVIFSAHGVAQSVRDVAAKHDIKVFDATCPLVTKVHIEVIRNSREGVDTILIGHRGHPEVAGTMGQYGNGDKGQIYLVESVEDAANIEVAQPDRLAYVTQTTLSVDDTQEIVDELTRRFPNIRAPRKDDICYATQHRQNAVKELVKQCDLILIIGSKSSSNSNRLREIPLKHGIEAYLIDSADEINVRWLDGRQCIGVSAGASAPELLVKEVVAMLKKYGVEKVDEMKSERETVSFPLPSELKTIVLN